MFAEHQPLLAELGRRSADGFARIATFAMLTIRQPLAMAVMDYPLVRAGDRSVRSVFGWKHVGLDDIEANKGDYHALCELQARSTRGEELEDGLLHILTNIHGLGPAKAGFIAQMIYGVSGCLDGHNLARFGLGPRPFRTDSTYAKPRTKAKTVTRYNRAVYSLGGTRALWDSWCCFMADMDPINYPTGEDVSAMHLIPLRV